MQPEINVFLGDNAAGKTTVLRCLALAAVGLPAANEVEEDAPSYLHRGTERGSIEVLFELIPDPDSLPGESRFFVVGLQITSESSRFTPLPREDIALRLPGEHSGMVTNSAEYLGELRSKSPFQFGFVAGYGAIRTFNENRDVPLAKTKERENAWVSSLFRPNAWLATPEMFTEMLRGCTSGLEESPTCELPAAVVEALRKSVDDMVPGENRRFFHEGDNDLLLNGTALRFGELSDGYRSLLALMGHLLRCSLRLRNWEHDPTRINGIALIDEVDLHLHPSWQIHAVQDFHKAFANLQLVASTHSPLIVGALKKEHVHVMRTEEDGHITIDHPLCDPQGLGVAGTLTSMFDLSSTIDQPTLDKIDRRLLLHSKGNKRTRAEQKEYAHLSDELAHLGFNREFSDPYFELFTTAMADHHRATLSKMTLSERHELDAYASRLLADIFDGGDK